MAKTKPKGSNDPALSAFKALQHVIDQTEAPQNEIDRLRERIVELERLCSELYEFAGIAGAPVRVLDTLSAAMTGRPVLRSILPISDDELRHTTAGELGRKGGLRSAAARMRKISPTKRRRIAKVAAAARWKKR